jgi:hypothetical protein
MFGLTGSEVEAWGQSYSIGAMGFVENTFVVLPNLIMANAIASDYKQFAKGLFFSSVTGQLTEVQPWISIPPLINSNVSGAQAAQDFFDDQNNADQPDEDDTITTGGSLIP